jgi:hypothetical protein
MKELQARGIVGIAIDARYHGKRSGGAKGGGVQPSHRQSVANQERQAMEHPFYYDTVWDFWQLDILETRRTLTRPLGMIGFSMGGIRLGGGVR